MLNKRSQVVKYKISFLTFWIIISTIYAAVFTTIEFSDNPYSGISGMINLFMQWAMVSFSAAGVLCLIAVNRYIFAVTFPILATVSAIMSFYKITMGVTLTPMLIELALINDTNTWATVMSPQLGLWAIIALSVSVTCVVIRFKFVLLSHPWIYTAVSIIIIAVPTHIITRFNAPVRSRMPYSFYYCIKDYLDNRKIINENRDKFDNAVINSQLDSPDVVVVIGESLRSDHVSMNGYTRNTFPNLGGDSTLISFPYVYTEAWCTHTSVPHIMTRADSDNPDIAYTEQSFITLFSKAGYRTSWISNQDTNQSYVYFMHEADTLIMGSSTKSLYNFDLWLDSDILPDIADVLCTGNDKKLLVIHSIGSHWWYRSHYPDSLACFKPEIDSRVLSDLTHDQIVNSYDNTILATDDFLSKVIAHLRNRNAILIYISDHGEALGENGNYLHADNYDSLHNPACFVWYSPEYHMAFPDKVKNLRLASAKEWSTDAIFHSVLDGASLQYDGINMSQSFFNQ